MEDYLLAGSKNLTLVQATELSQSPSVRVRSKLAANSSCPAMVLNLLAEDPNVEVRSAVGQNSSASANVLDALVKDSSVAVRFQMAGSAKLGDKRLQILLSDTNPYVAERALATFETIMLEENLAMLNLPQTESRPLLGQLLVEALLINDGELKVALEEAFMHGVALGHVLLLRRLCTRYVLVEALLVQSLIGQHRLSFDEGVYYLKREARLNGSNMFRPGAQHGPMQQVS